MTAPTTVEGWAEKISGAIHEGAFKHAYACNCTPRILPILRDFAASVEETIARKSVCTYCGHMEESADNEARFEAMVAHIVACEKHPLRQIPLLLERAEKAEAEVTKLRAERDCLARQIGDDGELLDRIDVLDTKLAEARGLLAESRRVLLGDSHVRIIERCTAIQNLIACVDAFLAQQVAEKEPESE